MYVLTIETQHYASLSLNRPPERAGCLNDGWWSSNPKAEPTTPLGTVSNLVCILPILTLL